MAQAAERGLQMGGVERVFGPQFQLPVCSLRLNFRLERVIMATLFGVSVRMGAVRL